MYLKRPFVIEDIETGAKVAVTTFRQYAKMTPAQKSIAREFQRDGETLSLGTYVVRKHEAFELV